jgi:small subunit ribosomal protein S3
MIERKFVAHNIKEFLIKEFIASSLSRVGLSDIKLKRTPLGDKIVISTLKPGLVVGRAGANINALTKDLKEKFNLNNPQIELDEIKNPFNDPAIIAEQIVNSLERFGTKRFKGIGHKVISDVMNDGAAGIEILISGKVPSSRAKTWRFYQGYLKKCGDISIKGVKKTQAIARLKSGVIGVQVSILPADVILPDKIKVSDKPVEVIEELDNNKLSEAQEELIKKIETQESKDEVKESETTDKKSSSKNQDSEKKVKPKKSTNKKSSSKTSKTSKKEDKQ